MRRSTMRWAAIASMIGAAVLMVTALALTPAASGQGQGNPGTIKINDEDIDRFPANVPHVGCVFRVGFFGFPDGSEASVNFAAHPPTGTGALLSDEVTLNGDTVETYDLTNLLANFEPHPQQGFHIKLDVNVDGAPGGSKSKVFWVVCEPPEVTTTTEAPTTTTTEKDKKVTTTTTEKHKKVTTTTTAPEKKQPPAKPPAPPAPPAPEAAAPPAPGVAAPPAPGVAAQPAPAPAPRGELAVTGSSTPILAGLGGLLLASGAAMYTVSRRRGHLV
jgi:LPXTG-motif cell wall-anchored protein